MTVDVQGLQAGALVSTSGALTSDLPVSTPGAAATLTVNDGTLVASMSFTPAKIRPGGVSTLTYRLRNDTAARVRNIFLRNNLPIGVVLAADPDAQTTCTVDTLTAQGGGNTITFTGGGLDAGATCTITVDVTSTATGSYLNSTVFLTWLQFGSSAELALATLTVTEAEAPGFTKAFSPAAVDPGGVSTLTFTIDNTANGIDVGSLAFDDIFPISLIVADNPNADNSCGGTFAPVAPATSLTFSGGSVAAGETCTISVDVTTRVPISRTLVNTSGALTSDLPDDAPGASVALTVTEAPLGASISFTPAEIVPGGVSTLTHRLRNDTVLEATSVFLSNILPANVVLAANPDARTTCTGDTLTAQGGGNTISFTGGGLDAGASCTIAVDVTSTAAGSYPNSSVFVTSSHGSSDVDPATLTVVDPVIAFARAFSPATIDQGETSTLIFTMDNSGNAIEADSLEFVDPLPAGLVVAAAPGVSNSCGGTFDAPAGGDTLTFADGTLAEGDSCEIRVTVRAIGAGTLTNPVIGLSSSIGASLAAPTTLTVTPAGAPGFAKAFAPAMIDQSGTSTLTFTIDNGANAIAVDSLAFDDAFPDGMTVALTPNADNSCGGTFAPVASATSLTFSGGSVTAGETCTISVDVTTRIPISRTLVNTSGALTSDLPDDAPGASAALTVTEAPLGASISFTPAEIVPGGVSTLTHRLRNDTVLEATSVFLSNILPANVVLAANPDARTTCTGDTLAAAGGNTISFTGGTLAPGDDCTISVDVTSTAPGSYPNGSVFVTSSLGTSEVASAALTVVPVEPLGFAFSFSPDTVDPGETTKLTYTIDNTANGIGVGSLRFTDQLLGVGLIDTPNFINSCGGTAPIRGRLDGIVINHSGGSVAAGASCTISLDVQVLQRRGGTQEHISDTDLTSELLVATPGTSATLTVNSVPLVRIDVVLAGDDPARWHFDADPSPAQRHGIKRSQYLSVQHTAGRCGAGRRPRCADDLHRHAGGQSEGGRPR